MHVFQPNLKLQNSIHPNIAIAGDCVSLQFEHKRSCPSKATRTRVAFWFAVQLPGLPTPGNPVVCWQPETTPRDVPPASQRVWLLKIKFPTKLEPRIGKLRNRTQIPFQKQQPCVFFLNCVCECFLCASKSELQKDHRFDQRHCNNPAFSGVN